MLLRLDDRRDYYTRDLAQAGWPGRSDNGPFARLHLRHVGFRFRARPSSPGHARRDAMARYERLSPLDRTFLDLEYPEAHMHVAGVTIFDAQPLRTAGGGIDIEKSRKYVGSR